MPVAYDFFTTFTTLSGRSTTLAAYLIRYHGADAARSLGVALGLAYGTVDACGRAGRGKELKGDATFHVLVATAVAFRHL
jgi:hypothetical protein